jgi:hypothetical protein
MNAASPIHTKTNTFNEMRRQSPFLPDASTVPAAKIYLLFKARCALDDAAYTACH